MNDAYRDWTLHRPENRILGTMATAVGDRVEDDACLVGRVTSAYRRAVSTDLGSRESFWLTAFEQEKMPIHDALIGPCPSTAADLLRDPSGGMLHLGFDCLVKGGCESHRKVYDNLLALAEATGAVRLDHPEGYDLGTTTSVAPDVEDLLARLDDVFGFRVAFPNPFANEIGLLTSRGVATRRAVFALHQAWRMATLTGPGARVLEIGAGLGRTAFYARAFGILDYTIVDIPMTNVAQANFLGRVLGERAISLFGEAPEADRIKIVPPETFMAGRETYDLIVNVDSMTEMARATADAYAAEIVERAPLFLSINHELNAFTVRDVVAAVAPTARVTRGLYWLRRGYVEELVHAPPRAEQPAIPDSPRTGRDASGSPDVAAHPDRARSDRLSPNGILAIFSRSLAIVSVCRARAPSSVMLLRRIEAMSRAVLALRRNRCAS